MTFDDLPDDLRVRLRDAGVTTLADDIGLRGATLTWLRGRDPDLWTALAVHALRTAGSVPLAAPMLGLSTSRLFALRKGDDALLAVATRPVGNPTFGTPDAPPPPKPRKKKRANA